MNGARRGIWEIGRLESSGKRPENDTVAISTEEDEGENLKK